MIKIALLDRITLPDAHFEFGFPFSLTEHWQCPPEQTVEAVHGHEIVITNKVNITRSVMQANPQLKLIAVSATGFNNVDIDAARELGITVCNVRGYSTRSVAEHAFMMILALLHKLPVYQKKVEQGDWPVSPFFSVDGPLFPELAGKTLAIIGKGDIGQQLARFAKPFGINSIFAEHKNAAQCRNGYVPFNDAIKCADIISLHCPLNPDTHHLIGEKELSLLKPDSILINVSRGGLVDEAALAAALKEGQLAGAGFDVLSAEPPQADNPLLDNTLNNFILTPHIAWRSKESVARLTADIINNINGFIQGCPVNVVS